LPEESQKEPAMQITSQPDPITDSPQSPGIQRELIYDLRLREGRSDSFYAEASRLTDKVLLEIQDREGTTLQDYGTYVQKELLEPIRSRGEYAIELLMMGLVLQRYAGAAENTPRWAVRLARGLFRLRCNFFKIKPATDLVRASVIRAFLMPKIGCETTPGWRRLKGLRPLIDWLRATGEFEQEARRLENWSRFLDALPEEEAERVLISSLEIFDWFHRESNEVLGRYTPGVKAFLSQELCKRGPREDQLFCAKVPVEYHLNMVAAETMNRGLRADFEQTTKRVVLVPGCMRGARAGTCQADLTGTDIACAACDPACPVNQITTRLREKGTEVFMVLHSTGFSRWLQRWQRAQGYGVTAVACLLNILPGGYEMRDRGIASQCVPLDFPGCSKHWDREGIATAVNEERLVRIVAAGGRLPSPKKVYV
jgi:uncharacterized protein